MRHRRRSRTRTLRWRRVILLLAVIVVGSAAVPILMSQAAWVVSSSNANSFVTGSWATFGATDLGNNGTAACSSGASCSLTLTTAPTSGRVELVLIYLESNGSGSTVSSITGPWPSTGTGSPSQINSKVLTGNSSKDTAFAWQATANATTKSVTVNFSSGTNGNPIIVDVVQLGFGDSVVTSGVNTGSSTSATATVTTTTGDSEVAFVSSTSNTTISTPTGFSKLDGNNSGGSGGYAYGSFDDSTVQSSTSFTVGNSAWGTIAIEINP